MCVVILCVVILKFVLSNQYKREQNTKVCGAGQGVWSRWEDRQGIHNMDGVAAGGCVGQTPRYSKDPFIEFSVAGFCLFSAK